MIQLLKKSFAFAMAASIALTAAGCGKKDEKELAVPGGYEDAARIVLSDTSATLNGKEIEEFDYTWHCDPSVSHDEVKNAPAEYYTGTKPETDAAVYIDHELYYYPALDESSFQLLNYDGEMEWAYYYTDGEHDDYIFATLPHLGNTLPSQMMHTEEEAAENKVLHITKPGTYILEGSWKGQVWVDLGDKDDTFTDSNAKVTLILNNADIECSVAPGLVFYSAYECDNEWESRSEWSADVDTSDAGVTVILASGSKNIVTGTNIFRMLKPVYKNPDSSDTVKVQKKMRKIDAAFYSFVSMNIDGDGTLEVNSGFEGLDSELHLTIQGGNITINSQDDGINVNEDHVSVVNFAGGNVTINAALGAEGDGVDSNGFIAVNGGNLFVNGIVRPDSALDSEDGIYYSSGTISIDGEAQSYTSGSVFRETGNTGGKEQFGDRGKDFGFMTGREGFDMKDFKEKVAELPDDASFEDVLSILGMNAMPGGMGRAEEGMPFGQVPGEPPKK